MHARNNGKRIVLRLLQSPIAHGFQRWAYATRARRPARISGGEKLFARMLQRLLRATKARGFRRWALRISARSTGGKRIAQILLRLLFGAAARGFERWVCLTQLWLRERLVVHGKGGKIIARVIIHWNNGVLERAFAVWRSVAMLLLKAKRQVIEAVQARIALHLKGGRRVARLLGHFGLGALERGFATWRRAVFLLGDEQAQPERLEALASAWDQWHQIEFRRNAVQNGFHSPQARLTALAAAWERWQRIKLYDFRIRLAAMRILRIMLRAPLRCAFSQWCDVAEWWEAGDSVGDSASDSAYNPQQPFSREAEAEHDDWEPSDPLQASTSKTARKGHASWRHVPGHSRYCICLRDASELTVASSVRRTELSQCRFCSGWDAAMRVIANDEGPEMLKERAYMVGASGSGWVVSNPDPSYRLHKKESREVRELCPTLC